MNIEEALQKNQTVGKGKCAESHLTCVLKDPDPGLAKSSQVLTL